MSKEPFITTDARRSFSAAIVDWQNDFPLKPGTKVVGTNDNVKLEGTLITVLRNKEGDPSGIVLDVQKTNLSSLPASEFKEPARLSFDTWTFEAPPEPEYDPYLPEEPVY